MDVVILKKNTPWKNTVFTENVFIKKVPFPTSCLPAAKNMFLHFSFDTIGTLTWKYYSFCEDLNILSWIPETHVLENGRQHPSFTEATPSGYRAKLPWNMISCQHQSFAVKWYFTGDKTRTRAELMMCQWLFKFLELASGTKQWPG